MLVSTICHLIWNVVLKLLVWKMGHRTKLVTHYSRFYSPVVILHMSSLLYADAMGTQSMSFTSWRREVILSNCIKNHLTHVIVSNEKNGKHQKDVKAWHDTKQNMSAIKCMIDYFWSTNHARNRGQLGSMQHTLANILCIWLRLWIFGTICKIPNDNDIAYAHMQTWDAWANTCGTIA